MLCAQNVDLTSPSERFIQRQNSVVSIDGIQEKNQNTSPQKTKRKHKKNPNQTKKTPFCSGLGSVVHSPPGTRQYPVSMEMSMGHHCLSCCKTRPPSLTFPWSSVKKSSKIKLLCRRRKWCCHLKETNNSREYFSSSPEDTTAHMFRSQY